MQYTISTSDKWLSNPCYSVRRKRKRQRRRRNDDDGGACLNCTRSWPLQRCEPNEASRKRSDQTNEVSAKALKELKSILNEKDQTTTHTLPQWR